MKRLALFALALSASAIAADVDLTPEEAQACKEGGGCFIITDAKFKAALTAAYKMGVRDGYEHCKGDA